jgi:hypothetical protein
MRRFRVLFRSSNDLDFAEIGIPLEVFRKKRAHSLNSNNLHFKEDTLKILKSSNAHCLVEKK